MQHKTFAPNQDLSPLIKSYWTLESPHEQTPTKNTIVPDGCMKLIFHYGAPYKHYPDNGDEILLPKCFLIGQLTQPYAVAPTGETGTFFVCFHPNGFSPFANSPIREMENTAVPLEELFGEAGRTIGQEILNAATTQERITLIEAFLFDRLTKAATIDHIVESTVETILTANGQLTVDELSRLNDTNRRQLVRKFSSTIGLSPKKLSKTVRLQATLKALLTTDIISLTDVAYENGYYDQAHFIKDFKELTGLTPREFYGDHLKMSLIFDGEE